MRRPYQCGQGRWHSRFLPIVDETHGPHECLTHRTHAQVIGGAGHRLSRVRETRRVGHLLDGVEHGIELQPIGLKTRLEHERPTCSDPVHERQDFGGHGHAPRVEELPMHPASATRVEDEQRARAHVAREESLLQLPSQLRAVLGDVGPEDLVPRLVRLALRDHPALQSSIQSLESRVSIDHEEGVESLDVDEAVCDAEVTEHDVLVAFVESHHDREPPKHTPALKSDPRLVLSDW